MRISPLTTTQKLLERRPQKKTIPLDAGGNSSTVVFCIFAAIIHSSGVSFKSVFLAYTALPVFIFVSSLLLFPDRPFESGNKDDGRFKGGRFWKIEGRFQQLLVFRYARGLLSSFSVKRAVFWRGDNGQDKRPKCHFTCV